MSHACCGDVGSQTLIEYDELCYCSFHVPVCWLFCLNE